MCLDFLMCFHFSYKTNENMHNHLTGNDKFMYVVTISKGLVYGRNDNKKIK